MNETDWRVIIRFAADASTPAYHAVTIVRIKPNAMTAMRDAEDRQDRPQLVPERVLAERA